MTPRSTDVGCARNLVRHTRISMYVHKPPRARASNTTSDTGGSTDPLTRTSLLAAKLPLVGAQAAPHLPFSESHRHAALSLEDRLEIFELVKEMPDVAVRSVDAVRMQIGKGRVITVAVERLL